MLLRREEILLIARVCVCVWCIFGGSDLLVDLLEEGDFLLQSFDASLQVQACEGGCIHILFS